MNTDTALVEIRDIITDWQRDATTADEALAIIGSLLASAGYDPERYCPNCGSVEDWDDNEAVCSSCGFSSWNGHEAA